MARVKVSVCRHALAGTAAGAEAVARAVAATIHGEKIPVPCFVSVTITDDSEIWELNRRFRNVDRPTDVLSFPMWELRPGDFDPADCEPDPDTGAVNLGDMVLSWEHAVAQGREYGHSAEREAVYLAIHSTLHLLGYDHMDEGPEKRRMRRREKAILASLGWQEVE